MKNPNIVFTAPYVTEVLDYPMPKELGEYDVLLKIQCTTISSGTERANLIGDANVAGTNAPQVKFPRQAGYSAGAVVEAVGEKVTRVKVGDRVAASWTKHAAYYVKKEDIYKAY